LRGRILAVGASLLDSCVRPLCGRRLAQETFRMP
jgi:hypothetical protein